MQLTVLFLQLVLAIGGLACDQHGEHQVVARQTSNKIAPGPSDTQTQFAPLPAAVHTVTIDPKLGYFVGDLGKGAYWVNDGIYSMMFMVSTQGVIVVDAPPTIGHNILLAIGNKTHLPVTHVVYSHFHQDHIGAASIFNSSHPIVIAHALGLTALTSLSPLDPLRPLPSVTFQSNYNLTVGNQTLQLSYHGPSHTSDNIFMYAPAQRVAVLVDVIFPGWAPFGELGVVSGSVQAFTSAHDVLLSFDFDFLMAGHVGQLGTRQDVLLQKQYVQDLHDTCQAAIYGGVNVTSALGPTVAANPGNAAATLKAYFRAAAQLCADNSTPRWLSKLGGVDVFAFENAYRTVLALLEGQTPVPTGTAAILNV
ncbi:beta-lactamase-like protein [Mycena filopes]|nr:beta-lactamase-like protein [Mycena filopes]